MLQDGEKGVIVQRDKKTYAIAPHIPCGMVSPEMLRQIADISEKYGAQAIKITSAARIALIGIEENDIDDVWNDLGMQQGFVVGICVRSIKACPGTTFCKKGKQDSLGLGMKLDGKYHGKELPGKFKIGVSGCAIQCAETCIKDFGFVGMADGWRILVGGNGGGRPRLAQELTKGLTTDEAMELLTKVLEYYKANARPHQRIGAMLEKMDFEEFKAAVLGE
ncbi:MAG: NAD(P)/FAD-dependent oxidoreductase [Anaerohalosphaera sp.]|nr:NAD(P)/FAD-dependent oxidoreductase [Anaerohalosphaera sp.]